MYHLYSLERVVRHHGCRPEQQSVFDACTSTVSIFDPLELRSLPFLVSAAHKSAEGTHEASCIECTYTHFLQLIALKAVNYAG